MKTLKIFLAAAICALSVLGAGCNKTNDNSSVTESSSIAAESVVTDNQDSEATSGEDSTATAGEDVSDLWSDTVYTEDTELGEGEKTVEVAVKAGDKDITVTVHTDAENLGAALTENSLVEGDQSEYGLYIKVVNGIKADYDTDGAYWAISKDGELTPTGADSTAIADGEHYELAYTKG